MGTSRRQNQLRRTGLSLTLIIILLAMEDISVSSDSINHFTELSNLSSSSCVENVRFIFIFFVFLRHALVRGDNLRLLAVL